MVRAGDAFAAAAAGATNAGILDPGQPTDAATGATADHPVLRAYLAADRRGRLDGCDRAVWRDAAPIVGELGHVQEQMLAITLVAAAVAALVLYLVFRGAHDADRAPDGRAARSHPPGPVDRDAEPRGHGAELTAAWTDRAPTWSRSASPLIDLDNFRLLNDTHGHGAGDDALLRLARLVERHRPLGATTGRFGPDEFLVIAPAASIVALRPGHGELRHALVDESLQFGASERLPITDQRRDRNSVE